MAGWRSSLPRSKSNPSMPRRVLLSGVALRCFWQTEWLLYVEVGYWQEHFTTPPYKRSGLSTPKQGNRVPLHFLALSGA